MVQPTGLMQLVSAKTVASSSSIFLEQLPHHEYQSYYYQDM